MKSLLPIHTQWIGLQQFQWRFQSSETEATKLGESSQNVRQIILTEDDRKRIYNPWRYSVIIKLMGKRLMHHYLKQKVQDLWKHNENFSLIDVEEDYYTVKFAKEENMIKVLQNGPCFINGFFLSVQKWVPNFVAKKAQQSYTAIWVRLPQLPTEFYDKIILTRIGNSIGKLLKVDVCTSATLRGRYARLCLKLPLEQPVQNHILVGHHKQAILYEGENILCKACGRIGHTCHNCSYSNQPIKQKGEQKLLKISQPVQEEDQEWQTVSFPKKARL
ncbi:uncharacterized protein [Nicotiana tomentosiformis]|uniref:uncharacterized protein n=1 Tax=Nicotiana tomentosiformis TaxID=4098 RepID=UPI00388C75CD